jgi:hypothetical protein
LDDDAKGRAKADDDEAPHDEEGKVEVVLVFFHGSIIAQ